MSKPNRLGERFHRWRETIAAGVDQEAVEAQLVADGGLSYAYIFLVVTSCAIATLGLMLNSASVIIGAMLVAPLMNPIILLGLSIARTDVEHAIRAAKALAVGVVGALSVSSAIVKLSPFIAPTQEILSRTHPNLFDMLVAIFSGLVGGFALIRRQLGTIAGVAIATALMPPLATSGYGLATDSMDIFKGGFFLFLTNMLAIAFSIAGIAAWYGFANLRAPRALLSKTLVAGCVLALLCVPLADSLNRSVRRALVSNQVEGILRDYLRQKQARLGDLKIDADDVSRVRVQAIVFIPRYDGGAVAAVENQLRRQLHLPVELSLDQVVLAKEDIPSAGLVAPLAAAKPPEADLLQHTIRELSPVNFSAIEVDAGARQARLQVDPRDGSGLDVLRRQEQRLQAQFPDWKITVLPPPQPLPPLRFAVGSADLDAGAQAQLALDAWYLDRQQAAGVDVTGFMDSRESRASRGALAGRRARAVATALTALHHPGSPQAAPVGPRQRRLEPETGWASWRRAEIREAAGTAGSVRRLDADAINRPLIIKSP